MAHAYLAGNRHDLPYHTVSFLFAILQKQETQKKTHKDLKCSLLARTLRQQYQSNACSCASEHQNTYNLKYSLILTRCPCQQSAW